MIVTWQDAEKVGLLTRPTPARRDASFPGRRSRFPQRLPVPNRVRIASSLAAAFLSILRGCSPLVLDVQAIQGLLCRYGFPAACQAMNVRRPVGAPFAGSGQTSELKITFLW